MAELRHWKGSAPYMLSIRPNIGIGQIMGERQQNLNEVDISEGNPGSLFVLLCLNNVNEYQILRGQACGAVAVVVPYCLWESWTVDQIAV